jgi:hypothetical protein
MGYSRVLHIADYSSELKYLNKIVDINPDYILYLVTILEYITTIILAFTVYYIVAVVTTFVYRKDKFALSFRGAGALFAQSIY